MNNEPRKITGMDWWSKYFTEKQLAWVYFRTWIYTKGNLDGRPDPERLDLAGNLFEQLFNQAENEMAERDGVKLLVWQFPDKLRPEEQFQVEYSRGKTYRVTPAIWAVRRIRSLAARTLKNAADPVGRQISETNISNCNLVADFFSRIHCCLICLSREELLATFHRLRFADYACDDFDFFGMGSAESRDEGYRDALPDECAPPILEKYGVTDDDLIEWQEKKRGAQAKNRFDARARLRNCLTEQYGPKYEAYALTGSCD